MRPFGPDAARRSTPISIENYVAQSKFPRQGNGVFPGGARLQIAESETGGGTAAELVPPGDPVALASAVERLLGDGSRAEALAARGLELTRDLTLEAEARRVAAFVKGAGENDSKRRKGEMQT